MSRKTPPEFEVKIDQLVFGGEGIGHFDGRPIFVYGVLPGETVLVRPIKVNSRYVKAAIVEIIEPSPDRIESKKDHYLTCSPWQVIPYEKQLEYKKEVVRSMWQKLAHELPQSNVDVVASPDEWEYRNKLEFSVSKDDDGSVSLAFHQRFRHSRYYHLDSCVLGSKEMNAVAQIILDAALENGYTVDSIKNILVRYSFSTKSVIGSLYTTDKKGKVFNIEHPSLVGFSIIYSDPRSPAAITTKILSKYGKLELKENIAGLDLLYGQTSFFQVNPSSFTILLNDIKEKISNKNGTLLDLYAGVGTIGLALAGDFTNVKSIELSAEASEFAIINTQNNKLENVEVIHGASEEQPLVELFSQADTVVVDPPRAGLHHSVVDELINSGPKNLIYISCNPATQARDWELLKVVYKTTHWKLYDLYPQTPHVESVLILEK